MKRIQEKVKDLIEVRSYKSLQDFISEPAQTLSIYHFTDSTSDLMTKYFDKVAAIDGRRGAATALAGYRGVGKSHLLAAFGALTAHPELRSKIADARVAASLQRLKRGRYPVAYVRRGSGETLFAELKNAIAESYRLDAANLPDSLPLLLSLAADKAGELPFILIVDTAFERVSRVARDDGALLGEIAERSQELNMFVVAALDDDIADADGINAAIARNFTIDYLDQEHLYRIVDVHLFPKIRQMQGTLHEIYTNFREFLPGFRWSEQRFAALYPLHPIILEIAPFVRLYAPEFALLGFAADAGVKILARPANSLIALDEVFDTLENSLRKSADLAEPFAVYDDINKNHIAQISIMQRLQAKLVLKALFLLSLNGSGTTAQEIAASMLIYDESGQGKTAQSVERLLEDFAVAHPTGITRAAEPGRDARFNLIVGEKNNFGSVLNQAIKTIPASVIPTILRRAAHGRFAEWLHADNAAGQSLDAVEATAEWRGSVRRGRVVWDLENIPAANVFNRADMLDWEVIVTGNPAKYAAADSSATARIFWQPAPLRRDEAETILRYYVLLSDKNLHAEHAEQMRTSGHAHVLLVEKIWNRIFLEDAKIIVENIEYPVSAELRNAAVFSEMIVRLLEPFFEKQYPDHPYFTETLNTAAVSALVGDFFGGVRQSLSETQHLAETFALPLGLVALDGTSYVAETEEHLVNLRLTEPVLALIRANPEGTISLREINDVLKKQPYGLVDEAQHLILTALVAQRQIEFVTTHGDRINRRSLDLKIIWNDIEGVAKPSSIVYSDERLTEWARILTGSDEFGSINQGDRELVVKALEKWLADWKATGTLGKFEKLADEVLNTKIWRLSAHVEKTFSGVAATLHAVIGKSIALEEGLHRIADAFNDSERNFFDSTKKLIVLEDFIKGVAVRERVKNYLIVCENTGDAVIESRRAKLSGLAEQSYLNPNDDINRNLESAWDAFHADFTEFYTHRHDAVMKSQPLQTDFDDVLKSDEWWEFENLARLGIFEKNFLTEAENIARRFRKLDCRFETKEMLKLYPFCACSFSLKNTSEAENLHAALKDTLRNGRAFYLTSLRRHAPTLLRLIGQFAEQQRDNEFREAAAELSNFFSGGGESKPLTNNQLVVLREVCRRLPAGAPNLRLETAI